MEAPTTTLVRRPVLFLVGALLLIALIIAGVLGTNTESGCVAAGDCACESLDGGVASQETNALTSLAFLALGWIVLAAGPAGGQSVLTATRVRLFGVTLLLTGTGSVAFHASVTEFAGWVDLLGAAAIPSFALLHRLSRRDGPFVVRFIGTLCGIGLLVGLVGTEAGRFVMTVLVVSAVLAELGTLLLRQRGPAPVSVSWLAGAVVIFAGATWFWYLGRDSSQWCRPDSVWQWHGLWHLTAALALFALFMHWRQEAAVPG